MGWCSSVSLAFIVFLLQALLALTLFAAGEREDLWHSGLSATMIKFLPLDFLGGSQRILLKSENGVYRLQISALVPEIFKFEKCVKYANEMTDDVIYSSQFYIMYIGGFMLTSLFTFLLICIRL